MTVSTPYFDYVFNRTPEAVSELDWVTRKIDRLEQKEANIERLLSIKSGPKRLARLSKTQDSIAAYKQKATTLIAELAGLNATELPQDSATFTFWKTGDTITGLNVTITDSPYDDTYVGGEDFTFTTTGTDGFRGFNTRVTFEGEDFADGTELFGMSSDNWAKKLDGSYSDVMTSITQGDNTNFVTTVFADGVGQL